MKKLLTWSDVPAALSALVAVVVTFFPPQTLTPKVVILIGLVVLMVAFLVLKRCENTQQENALRRLQHSIDDLVRDLRGRDKRLLELQQQDRPRPLVVVEYDCDFEKQPEKPLNLQNVGTLQALNVSISPIEFENHLAIFEEVPSIAPGGSAEVLPDLEEQGLVFRYRLRILLDAAFKNTRWRPSRNLPKSEIEELFDQPVTFPLTVRYRDPHGNSYVGEFELVYIYFAARAFVRLRT